MLYLIAFMNILGLWVLTLMFYNWIIQDFKQRKKGLTIMGIIVGIVMVFNFYLACIDTPVQVRALTTQVKTLTRQVEILEQNQKGAKP
jgi:outer membrane murein-binding lipoprotein Lpp